MEWKNLLLGSENWSFLAETAFRTLIMFIVILVSLRMLGKRGVKQLSVFELGVIIGLGSAAGDPMFYKDVGLLPGIIVFAGVISLYRFITFLINRSNKFEKFLEGTPRSTVKNGRILVSNFKKEPIAFDELYSQLRMHGISHLGQVEQAIIETNGEVSVYYFKDEDVSFGLPILPDLCEIKFYKIEREAVYACTHCGNVQQLQPATKHLCERCHHYEWLPAINNKRIT